MHKTFAALLLAALSACSDIDADDLEEPVALTDAAPPLTYAPVDGGIVFAPPIYTAPTYKTATPHDAGHILHARDY